MKSATQILTLTTPPAGVSWTPRGWLVEGGGVTSGGLVCATKGCSMLFDQLPPTMSVGPFYGLWLWVLTWSPFFFFGELVEL